MELARPALDAGLVVADIEASLAFYRDVLGLKVLSQTEVPGIGQYTICEVGQSRLKLIVREKGLESQAVPGGLGAPVGGVRYLTYPVTDVEAVVAEVTAAGYTVQMQVRSFGDTKVAIVADPDGNWVDLMEERSG